MANEIANGNNVLVEFSENNILLVDPNKIYENGNPVARLVEPENLTIYANLTARVVPRSKLISGVALDTQSPESFVDIFEGDINFLKPGNKDYLTTQWTDMQTGFGVGSSNGLNQDYTNPLKSNFTGQDASREKILNKLDGESFGIENISVTIKKGFIPQVNITFIDVRGQTLFEQGANSPYAAFFQLPYPLFNLILKGYYGKAVKYQLMLKTFNASFDGNTGNYIVSCSFIGRIAALLNDITLQELRAAPYMFSKTYTLNNPDDDSAEPKTVMTSRGRQILEDVYNSYKTLGIVSDSLPHLTLDELIEKIKSLDTTIEKSLEKEDLTVLDDIEEYDKNIDIYRKKILNPGGWKYTYTDQKADGANHYYIDRATQETYYRWKKIYQEDVEDREAAIQKLKQEIDKFNKALENNATFGKNGKSAIPVTIKYEDFLAPKPEGYDQYNDEWFVFDIRAESFGEKISDMFAIFNTKRNEIEQQITLNVNNVVINALGFKPTVRNLFAIIVAQADTFLRLMDDTHTKAFAVRNSKYRLEAVNGGGKSSLTSELPEENFIYPWPHYYLREESNGTLSFVSTYPGSVTVVNETKAYDPVLWPEVDFVEEFFKAQKIKDSGSNVEFNVATVGDNWLPITSFDFLENELYHTAAYTPLNYEIWDRSVVHTFFSGMVNRVEKDKLKLALNAMSHFESLNIVGKTKGYLDIQEFLKNQNFNYNTFLVELEKIAPQTNYQLLIRDLYNTDYLREKINNSRFSIHSNVTFGAANYYTNDGDIKTDIQQMELSLAYPLSAEGIEAPLETYPLCDFEGGVSLTFSATTSWVKLNLAGGQNIGSYQDLNTIHNSVVFSKGQKMFSSYVDTGGFIANPQFYSNINWLHHNFIYEDQNSLNIRTTESDHNTALKYKFLYQEFILFLYSHNSKTYKNKHMFLTEGLVNYGKNYKGNVSSEQTTSILNTPYFINSLVQGIKNEINDTPYPYMSAAYLFLNTLPLPTLREKTILGHVNYGDYIAKVLNQVSAVHPLPFAWILKYGSIWHRYKTFVKTGNDILTGIWNNFDANQYFNATNGLSNQYTLNVGPNNTPMILGGQWNIGGNFTKLNVGFYPELNNYMSYFMTGRLLYHGTNITGSGLTSNQINAFINDGTLNLKEANALMINSNPTSSTSQDMNCTFWYNYYDCARDAFLTGNTTPTYFLFPSAGGMKTQQLQFEVDNPQQLINNPIAHNGATRLAWGMSSYGFFEHQNNTFPSPTQYLQQIDTRMDNQYAFEITNNQNYSSIEELFDIFTPDILNVFESYFLDFCKKESQLKQTEMNGGWSLQKIIKSFLTVNQSDVAPATDSTEFSFNLGAAQLDNINSKLKLFLKYQIAFNFYNPKDVDIRVLRTLVGDTKYFDFGSYSNNLPPEISLSDSQTSNPQAWQTLKLQVGFYSELSSGTTSTGLAYSDSGSYATDFFRQMNIDFNSNNIELLRKPIRMYVTQRYLGKKNDTPVTVESFKGSVKTNIIDKCDDAQFNFLNQLFIDLKSNLPEVTQTQSEEFEQKAIFNTDENKLEQYMVFKTLNDKWISGEDFSNRLLFKDFLFLDIANRDIGDDAVISTDAIKSLDSAQNANLSLYHVLGKLLQGNFFNFLALPSYINFYGITSDGDREFPKFSTQEEANSIFGTHLEVDYLDSAPKFLCQYIGDPSTQLADLGPQTKYNSDSFMLGRTADNPLFSDCYNPDRCNKVVSFAVDFGVQNQGVFKSISLDQSEFKNTSESFIVTEMMAQSANDADIKTQGMSLFNVYKSRSYTCKIEAMGNVCIQPTMYFTLRHVPMFNGPYIILDVQHQIQPNTMTTTFTGVRVPFHRLPMVENLIGRVNKSFINKIRKKQTDTETKIARGGFIAEGPNEKRNKEATSLSKEKIKMIIVHVTAGINYGADPVGNINSQHKNRGFTGIGYHYVISRGSDGSATDGWALGGRPTNLVGAHVTGKNSESIGVAMVANCARMGKYDSGGGEYPTTAQKRTLEWLLLWILFNKRLLSLNLSTTELVLKFRDYPTDDVKLFEKKNDKWQSGNAGVTSKMWGKIIKGHNEFSNKLCPCFKMEEALTTGTLTTHLNDNLITYLKTKLFKNAITTQTYLEMDNGATFDSRIIIGLNSKVSSLVGYTTTPYPNDTTWSDNLA